MASFYGEGSTVSRLNPLRGCSLLFTTDFQEILGTHFINLGKMKGWVDLRDNHWFWTRDPWIGNAVPLITRPLPEDYRQASLSKSKKIVWGDAFSYCCYMKSIFILSILLHYQKTKFNSIIIKQIWLRHA